MDFTKQTYCNQVTSYIRSLIRKGTLEIGAPVKEAVLSEQLGISRAPIREALQVLVQEGLITSEPQKGKHVRQMTGKEIYDSYVVAGILEGAGVAESLPLWTEANMETFRSVVRQMEGKISYATKLDELAEIDELFHATLFMACDNTRLGGNGPHLLCDHIQVPLLSALDHHVHAKGIRRPPPCRGRGPSTPATSNMWKPLCAVIIRKQACAWPSSAKRRDTNR